MPTANEIREFRARRNALSCLSCRKLNYFTNADIMASKPFRCSCGQPLPFDRAKWHRESFKPARKTLDEQINARGRR